MGIESGPRDGDSYRPRTIEARIEGEVESSFTEIDMDQASHIPLPSQISWSTTCISFQEVEMYNMPKRFGMSSNVQLYACQLEYRDRNGKNRRSNLSLTTSKAKPVFFTGTTDGFYAHDPLMAGREHPFYVVGLQVDELEKKMSRMSSIWHELGHVALFHTDADTKLLGAAVSLRVEDLPQVALAGRYGNELARVLSYGIREQQPPFEAIRAALTRLESRNHDVDKIVHIFHERNAWAAGIHLVRGNGYPTGFQHQSSYFDYARLCLATYGWYYNDRRFVKGWR
ncbi:MAG: hypothetical protein HYT83_00405 [Candidatus Levybacteria bacterium]|nr:hypothetical protein [Candidatus Levybacteria bacterium]